MTFSYIPGDYEGFLMGDPEFEVHVFGRKTSSDTQMSDLQCAGEHAASASGQPGVWSSAYAYDQNSSSWTGSVQLIDRARIDSVQPLDSSLVYMVWEDDNKACQIVKAPVYVANIILGTGLLVADALKAIYLAGVNPWLAVGNVLRAVKDLIAETQNDDIVGILVRQSNAGYNYSDATHVIVDGTGGQQLQLRGRVKLVIQ